MLTRYPTNTLITREAFESSRWDETLNTAAREDYSSMWQALSTATREAVDGGNLEQGRVLWLLADAYSMMLKAGSINEHFKPDGKRSALPDDQRCQRHPAGRRRQGHADQRPQSEKQLPVLKIGSKAVIKRLKEGKYHQLGCKVDGAGDMMVTAQFVKKA